MNNRKSVQEIYEAFGRGDVPTILSKLSENVEWEYGFKSTDVPWLEPRTGKSGAAAFFGSLAAIDMQHFAVKTLLESDGIVVSLLDVEFTVKATGKKVIEEDEVHIWHFDSHGKVVRFRHRADTYQHKLATDR